MKQNNQPKEINIELVNLAAPILLNMPAYFGTNTFDIQSVVRVLRSSNCPGHLTDSVLENCEKAGIIKFSEDRRLITIANQMHD